MFAINRIYPPFLVDIPRLDDFLLQDSKAGPRRLYCLPERVADSTGADGSQVYLKRPGKSNDSFATLIQPEKSKFYSPDDHLVFLDFFGGKLAAK